MSTTSCVATDFFSNLVLLVSCGHIAGRGGARCEADEVDLQRGQATDDLLHETPAAPLRSCAHMRAKHNRLQVAFERFPGCEWSRLWLQPGVDLLEPGPLRTTHIGWEA